MSRKVSPRNNFVCKMHLAFLHRPNEPKKMCTKPHSPYDYCSSRSSPTSQLAAKGGKRREENCIYRTARKRILKQQSGSLGGSNTQCLLKLKVIFTFYRLSLRRMHSLYAMMRGCKIPSLHHPSKAGFYFHQCTFSMFFCI